MGRRVKIGTLKGVVPALTLIDRRVSFVPNNLSSWAVSVLSNIVRHLPRRWYPIKDDYWEAYVLGEDTTLKVLNELWKEGIILAYRGIPRPLGGVDVIAVLRDGSILLIENKNHSQHYSEGVSKIDNEVLSRMESTEKVIRRLYPRVVIHRILEGNMNLTQHAIRRVTKESVFLNLFGKKITWSNQLEAIAQLTRRLSQNIRDWITIIKEVMVSRVCPVHGESCPHRENFSHESRFLERNHKLRPRQGPLTFLAISLSRLELNKLLWSCWT